jgi:hypothetical protein
MFYLIDEQPDERCELGIVQTPDKLSGKTGGIGYPPVLRVEIDEIPEVIHTCAAFCPMVEAGTDDDDIGGFVRLQRVVYDEYAVPFDAEAYLQHVMAMEIRDRVVGKAEGKHEHGEGRVQLDALIRE